MLQPIGGNVWATPRSFRVGCFVTASVLSKRHDSINFSKLLLFENKHTNRELMFSSSFPEKEQDNNLSKKEIHLIF